MGRELGGARYFATWSCRGQGEQGSTYLSCTGGLAARRWVVSCGGREGAAVRSTPTTARAICVGCAATGCGGDVWQALSPRAHPLDYKELSWVEPEDEPVLLSNQIASWGFVTEMRACCRISTACCMMRGVIKRVKTGSCGISSVVRHQHLVPCYL